MKCDRYHMTQIHDSCPSIRHKKVVIFFLFIFECILIDICIIRNQPVTLFLIKSFKAYISAYFFHARGFESIPLIWSDLMNEIRFMIHYIKWVVYGTRVAG